MALTDYLSTLPPTLPILNRLLLIEQRLWQATRTTAGDVLATLRPLFELALIDPQLDLPTVYQRVAGVCAILQSAQLVSSDDYGRQLFPLWTRTIGQQLEPWVRSLRKGVSPLWSDQRYELASVMRYIGQVVDLARVMVWTNRILLSYLDSISHLTQELFTLPPSSPPPPVVHDTTSEEEEEDATERPDRMDESSMISWPVQCRACGRLLVRHIVAHLSCLRLSGEDESMTQQLHPAFYCAEATCQSLCTRLLLNHDITSYS